jgi:heterodisulfide reductase subunit A
MMDVSRHPQIELITYSEIEDIKGYVGNFQVTVNKKARYINEVECTACGDCAKVCPVLVHDEYQQGFSSRRAVYMPFPQAVPSAYLIDMKSCLGTNPIACGKCKPACEKKCINYDAKDEKLEFEVGAVVVATGLDVYDPTPIDEYGYRRFPNVITSLEFERLNAAGGPTHGHFIRPSDKEQPIRVGFIQCVGSRSTTRGNPYCSNICCMNTIKDTLLLQEHYPDMQTTVFYMDIRAFGKGFEDLYRKSREQGTKYIRGLPGEIREDQQSKNLILNVENTTTGKIEMHEFDMVVLSVGVVPREDSDAIKKLLTLSRTPDGFFLETHARLKPVEVPTKGVYMAGFAECPKDIKDSVSQAGAAASKVSSLLKTGRVTIEAITSRIDEDLCTMCGRCVKVCPYNAITKAHRKSNTYPKVIEAACAGCGACAVECTFGAITMRHFTDDQYYAQIESILAENPAEKVVVFACNWCSYAGGDTAGTGRMSYTTSPRLIRTMCSARVNMDFVKHALTLGAPIVLVSGCHFSDCHYISAVKNTQRRVEKLWDELEDLGIRPERVQLEWISAAEGAKFAHVMDEIEKLREKVTPEEIEETKRILKEAREKKQKKKEKKKTAVTGRQEG